jgi:septum site-determining protein MinC
MISLTIMRLFSEDLTAIGNHLRSQIERAPSLFRGAPLAMDLAALESAELDLAGLVELVRGQGIVPVAIRGGDDAMRDIADELNLGVLEWTQETVTEPQIANQDTAAEPQPTQPKTQDPTPATHVEKTPTRLITQPVRSGQHIYARGGDLLVLGTVSAGAEVIADGHIHVYGKLHGRALAGAQGDGEARIFVQSLEAELIAVAGVYMVSEELNEELRGSAVQAYLQGENLVLEAL